MKILGLLMTAGNNLENWYKTGSYEREIKLYKNLFRMVLELLFLITLASNLSRVLQKV